MYEQINCFNRSVNVLIIVMIFILFQVRCLLCTQQLVHNNNMSSMLRHLGAKHADSPTPPPNAAISGKVSCMVTDGAANMVACVETLKMHTASPMVSTWW